MVDDHEDSSMRAANARPQLSRVSWLDFDPEGYFPVVCEDCTSWRSEVAVDDQGRRVIREWHAASCPTLAQWS